MKAKRLNEENRLGQDASTTPLQSSVLEHRSARLRTDIPLSVVLGGGGVRGLAHLGVLEGLCERGFQISEMVGTSVGALILTYYAAVGLDVPTLKELGLTMSSRHLLTWALLRRAPGLVQKRWKHFAGSIPDYLERLSKASIDSLHHGVERIGLVSFDTVGQEEILFHNYQRELLLEDALRGAVAIPMIFPPRKCFAGKRELHLIDGGITNRLPVDQLFKPPFQPRQILAVDISNRPEHQAENLKKINRLRRKHPTIPIEVVCPDTLGKATIVYRTKGLQELIDSGKSVLESLLDAQPAAFPKRKR